MEIKTEKNTKPDHGFNVTVRRKRLGLSQEYVAEKLNEKFKTKLFQGDISRFENQEEIPDDMLEKFADVLSCPIEYLKNFDIDDAISNFTVINTNNDTITTGENATVEEVMQNKTQTINNNTAPEIFEMYKGLIKDVEKLNQEVGRLKQQLADKK